MRMGAAQICSKVEPFGSRGTKYPRPPLRKGAKSWFPPFEKGGVGGFLQSITTPYERVRHPLRTKSARSFSLFERKTDSCRHLREAADPEPRSVAPSALQFQTGSAYRIPNASECQHSGFGETAVWLLLVFFLLPHLAGCMGGNNHRSPSSPSVAEENVVKMGPARGEKKNTIPPPAQAKPDVRGDRPNLAAESSRPMPDSGSKPVRMARPMPTITKPQPARSGSFTEKLEGYVSPVEYLFMKSRHFPQAVVSVGLPLEYDKQPHKRFPLVIAFGGAGECARSPREGSLAWMGYYKTDEAVRALEDNHVVNEDFRGLAKRGEINSFNRRLEANSYGGVLLVCPYSPPLSPAGDLESPEYERFIVEELIPELNKRYRIAPGAIGVDGVSMGGARSMYYGFKYPEIFQSIGSVQGCFRPYFSLYRSLLRSNRHVLKKKSIQLVTSDGDFCSRSVRRMHKLLAENSIPHRFLDLTGPHDYIFNQGPGALALLIFHNEALSRRSAGPVR